ncbi:MAG: PqiC family protein [Desulfobacterales bacterium]|nr:PqiC family protein [Desulfobacterales bacterium]
MRLKPYFLYIFSFFILLLMSGCIGGTSQQSVYYVLSPIDGIEGQPSSFSICKLGVGPIKIPEFLNRPQIVSRHDENQLTIHEFHRWGDGLDTQITELMVENFSNLLHSSNVSAYPWERHFEPTFQLYMDVRELGGNLKGPVTLTVAWQLIESQSGLQVISRRTKLEEDISGEGVLAYVSAVNTLLNTFSQQIAGEATQELIKTCDSKQ